jgi:hypothetical protein
MRNLSGIRARVERLAAQIGAHGGGCLVCKQDETQVRFWWHNAAEPPLAALDAELAALPQTRTCERCGRTYALQYTVVSDLTPCEAPGCTCRQAQG